MSHRTAGIRTFGIRTLVSFALLTLSHCWHSHCWLRTGVVRTFVFRTLVVQAVRKAFVSEFAQPKRFVLCDLQIVSGRVYHLEQPQAESLFYVCGNTLIPFFDWKTDGPALHSIILFSVLRSFVAAAI